MSEYPKLTEESLTNIILDVTSRPEFKDNFVISETKTHYIFSFGMFPKKEFDEAMKKEIKKIMDREQVNSGLIESVGYDKSSSILEVEFNKSGDVWQYYDIPIEVYESMLISSSIGRFFLNNIKGKYKAIKQ